MPDILETDRSALELDEIEVTPEMVRAGMEEFAGFDYRFEAEEDGVARIYRAMAAKACGQPVHRSKA